MIKLMKTLKKVWFCTIISAMFVISLSLGVIFGLKNDPLSESNNTEIINPDEDIDALATTVTLPSGSTFNSYVKQVNTSPSQLLFMNYSINKDESIANGKYVDVECVSFKNTLYSYKIFGTEVFYKGLIGGWSKKLLTNAQVKTYSSITFIDANTILSNNCVLVVAPRGYEFLANSDCSSMFKSFSNLRSLTNIEDIDFSSATNMSSMFSGCSSLETCPEISASSARNVSNMFEGCTALTSVSKLSLGSYVNDRSSMFKGCSNLTYSGTFGPSVNMASMFENCSTAGGSITITLSGNFSNYSSYLSNMFKNCKTVSINLTDSTLSSSITDLSYFVSGYSSLKLIMKNTTAQGIAITSSTFSGKKLAYLDLNGAKIYSITGFSKMFQNCSFLTYLDLRTSSPTIKTATDSCTDFSYMFDGCSKLTDLYGLDEITASSASSPINLSYMFRNCSQLSRITFSSSFRPNVGAMEYMFYNCNKLISLDLSGFKTNNVTDMKYVFYGCNALTSLDISTFDTGSVMNMRNMFYYCGSSNTGFTLTFDKTKFTTANVKDMRSMFAGCGHNSSVFTLDVSNFETDNVGQEVATDDYGGFDGMFNGCGTATTDTNFKLDLSKFKIGKSTTITSLNSMFKDCGTNAPNFEIIGLNSSNLNTSNVTDMSYMFSGSGIKSIDVSYFDTTNVTTMASMFYNCKGLTLLDVSSFTTLTTTNVSSMFNNCNQLQSLNLKNFNIDDTTIITDMFSGCSKLEKIYADPYKWKKTGVTSSTKVFSGCTKLSGVVTSYSSDNVYANYAVIDMYDGHSPGYLTPTEPIEIDLPTNNETPVIYNGTEQELHPGNWSDIGGIGKLNENDKKKNVGVYSGLSISLKDTVYYVWKDGTNDSQTFTAEISKTSITVRALEEGYKVAYGAPAPNITEFDLVSGDRYEGDEFGTATYIVTDDSGAEITLGPTTLPGTYNIRLTGGLHNDNYIIEYSTETSTIEVLKISVEDVDITIDPAVLAYNGKEQKPIITITYGSMSFTETTDYTLEFSDNIDVGMAKVNIIGNTLIGSTTREFSIIESWMSNAAEDYAGGNGSEETPYQIATAGQLAKLAKDVNLKTSSPDYKYYVLTNNINLSGKEWIPIGSYADNNKYFTGSFDGNGFTISGMEIQTTSIDDCYFGLFGYTLGSLINNVNLSNVNIKINQERDDVYVGGIVGNGDGLTLTNCTTSGNLEFIGKESFTGPIYVGGLVGFSDGEILNCYNNIELTASSIQGCVGGIVGEGGNILYCLNNAPITINNALYAYCGGIAGQANEVQECMNFGGITASGDYVVAGICASVGEIDNCASLGNMTSTYYIANSNCSTYYVSTNGIKIYEGTFDPEIWFVANGINDGLPMLKSIYWIGVGYNNVSSDFTNAFSNRGYSNAA